MRPFRMAMPQSVEGACSVLKGSYKDHRVLGGGTDILSELKEGTQAPAMLVNLKAIPGLAGIAREARGLVLGALATLTDVAEHAEIKKHWPALATAAAHAATPQVRNAGTVGGNLCQRPRCWYYRHPEYPCLKKGGEICYARDGENEFHAIFDNATCNIIHPSNLAPALIAYGALVEIAGPDGKIEQVPVERFFVTPEQNITTETILEPSQVVVRVVLPAGSENAKSAFFEVREKQSYDWAVCASTVSLAMDGDVVRDARIVLSAVAPTPLRRADLEGMLKGQRITDELLAKLGEAAVAKATPLRDNKYKLILVKATLSRAIRQALKG
jgi:xanthine dehydrogenase YagS FAD-binding subunit